MKTTRKSDAEVIVNGLDELQYLPSSHNDPAQGQYNRLVKKRERARRNFFLGLRTRSSRRFWYWERAFDRTYRCDVCKSGHATECRVLMGDDEPPDATLCPEHARREGYCSFCGEWSQYERGFDFRGDGLCHGCRDELRECSPAGTFPGPFDIVVYSAPLRLPILAEVNP